MRPVWMLPGECDLIQPHGPVVYRLYGKDRELLYVGKTSTFVSYRIGKHMRETLWGGQVQFFSLEFHDTDSQALAAEVAAIRDERPVHNIRSAVA